MKSNIDLTSNEMFSRKTLKLSEEIFSHDFPWTYDLFIPIKHRGFSSEQQEIIFTGNRKDRELKNLCSQEFSGDYCNHCGAFLKRMPWNTRFDLCERCNSDLEREYTRAKYSWLNGFSRDSENNT